MFLQPSAHVTAYLAAAWWLYCDRTPLDFGTSWTTINEIHTSPRGIHVLTSPCENQLEQKQSLGLKTQPHSKSGYIPVCPHACRYNSWEYTKTLSPWTTQEHLLNYITKTMANIKISITEGRNGQDVDLRSLNGIASPLTSLHLPDCNWLLLGSTRHCKPMQQPLWQETLNNTWYHTLLIFKPTNQLSLYSEVLAFKKADWFLSRAQTTWSGPVDPDAQGRRPSYPKHTSGSS